jgi:copper transport protein
MAALSTSGRRLLLSAILAVLFGLLLASPAAAHAELSKITPANGAQLSRPPTEIQMTFTESVNLLANGIRLIDNVGGTVPTPDPTVDGRVVTWPMPVKLSDGTYVVTWRVVSADGHPISGASSFVVGSAVANSSAAGTGIPDTAATASEPAAPWQLVTVRFANYVAFAVFAGVTAFVLLCAPASSKDAKLQFLARAGLVGGGAATIAAILVQGPYTAGVSMSHSLDIQLLRQTLTTPFGRALIWRLALYAAVGILIWRLPRAIGQLGSWLVPAGLVGIAVTIATAGHGASSGLVELVVDAVHALTAALWVGGLIALVALGRAVQPHALHQFSGLAMISVVTLIVTGTVNSLSHLETIEQLWRTRYGLTLVIKLVLVAVTIGVAAVSRRRLQQLRVPLRSVRLEAALTVAVLAVTALLSMTAPPPKAAATYDHAAHDAALAGGNAAVQIPLSDRGTAALTVLPATTAGSHLHLRLTDKKGKPLSASRVSLKVANPSRDIAAIPVPMSMRDGVWIADYRFPIPGTWKARITVEGIGASAVVASADITIRG